MYRLGLLRFHVDGSKVKCMGPVTNSINMHCIRDIHARNKRVDTEQENKK